jgi:hypothetical protein
MAEEIDRIRVNPHGLSRLRTPHGVRHHTLTRVSTTVIGPQRWGNEQQRRERPVLAPRVPYVYLAFWIAFVIVSGVVFQALVVG